jgi:hypothetical protein
MTTPDQLLAQEILDRLHRLDEKQDRILESVVSLRERVNETEQDYTELHGRVEDAEDFVDTARSAGKVVIWLAAAIAGVASFIATIWDFLHGK